LASGPGRIRFKTAYIPVGHDIAEISCTQEVEKLLIQV
jgi:hypothetical protein